MGAMDFMHSGAFPHLARSRTPLSPDLPPSPPEQAAHSLILAPTLQLLDHFPNYLSHLQHFP